ncbi:hypothetical protein EMIHUDRAFT_457087 [Emiliania huxleyi CCMP1516]|uniref:S-adenosyl-L-methionine-dependent methyltransferase n=4 Tax=Emiliania huxleyi TaxID=2903 RepID=A0A0D3JWW2_EMIH1|nr:hypothetical protein EMIHUDRAFT_457087 [Emiliania huxleyi CCMP1516]EOD27997.1 hypothetical protein EMIHUDRAFT_457087 [Emiliania huxleyi CCMP1516]|eukprot:XP_005780426.1 hypothetical protein EMIHUDRAFT_457087 [Emiliania huxleyi CCMP1516]
MMPSMRLAAAGVACIVAPLTLLLLAPLTLLLLPILVPLGLLLTAVGVARAGIVVSMDGSRQRARSPRSPADRSGPQAEAASRSEEACATPSSRRKRRASWGSSSREGLPLDRRASSAQDLTSGAVLDGSLSTLNSLTAQRGGSLVRQVGELLRDNVARATHELRTEVEEQLAALQVELQSWVGANPNLKPYCHGRIGMLVLLFPLRRQLACLMPATIAADMVALRTWHLDREIAAALERSAGLPPQLVIVGAGLDFRCVRLAGSLGGGKVFELDFQGMLDEKWALLGAAGVPPPPHLVSVGCDLSLGPAGWVDELRRRGFDDRRPSVWLLEGLVPYLKPPELEALLRAISELSAPQSSLLATFISPTRPAGSVGASVSVSMNKYTTESPADTLSTFGPAAVVTIGELITRCGARGETMGIQPSDASYTFATACRE